jgi:signal transduction histidine kinase
VAHWGGKILVESEHGRGTTVTIALHLEGASSIRGTP